MFGYSTLGFGSYHNRGISAVYIVDDDGTQDSITAVVTGMGTADVAVGEQVIVPEGSTTTVKAYSQVVGGSPSYSYLWAYTEGNDPLNVVAPSATSSTSQNWTDLVFTAVAGRAGSMVEGCQLDLRVTDANGSVKFAQTFEFAIQLL